MMGRYTMESSADEHWCMGTFLVHLSYGKEKNQTNSQACGALKDNSVLNMASPGFYLHIFFSCHSFHIEHSPSFPLTHLGKKTSLDYGQCSHWTQSLLLVLPVRTVTPSCLSLSLYKVGIISPQDGRRGMESFPCVSLKQDAEYLMCINSCDCSNLRK